MDEFMKKFNGQGIKKIIAILALVAIAYGLRHVMNLVLLTFLFSFVFYNAAKLIRTKITMVKINEKVIISFLYLLFIGFVWFLCWRYIPVGIKQIVEIGRQIQNVDIENALGGSIDPGLMEIIRNVEIEEYLKSGGTKITETATKVSEFVFHLFLSVILSFFLLMEREAISKFGKRLEESKIASIYEYFKYFGLSFINSFGKVMQVQVTISFINTMLSAVMLKILGFPQIIGLSIMIFALGLIPVAGVIISLIPLSIIAFKIGGIIKIIQVIVMIIIIHGIEAYILNPNIMSYKVKLPVFITFTILILSEHYIGVWGLLIGIPLFIFFMDILDIKSEPDKKGKV